MQKNTHWILIRMFLLVAICGAINGCGTKGPLYIPERQYPQETPANK